MGAKMNKQPATKDDLDAEYSQLEHEYFIAKQFERPIDTELVQRMMDLLHQYYNYDVSEDADAMNLDETADEIVHRINQELDELRNSINKIVKEEL